MEMKKYFKISFACAMLISALAGCGKDEIVSKEWEVDKDNHWHVSESGNIVDLAAHDLEDRTCTVCDVQISSWGDDQVWLSRYNEQGDTEAWICYEEDGTVAYEERYEHKYNKDGSKLSEKCFVNGELSGEVEFLKDAEGNTYEGKQTWYRGDGTKTYIELDEKQEYQKEVVYDADGKVVRKLNYKHKYDKNGSKISEKVYEGKRLVSESGYSTDENGVTFESKRTLYQVDGTKTVYELNQYGETTKETTYDADGKAIKK